MEVLFDFLPKDLVYIIQDYAKDKTQYNEVIKEFNSKIGELVGRYDSYRSNKMIRFLGLKYNTEEEFVNGRIKYVLGTIRMEREYRFQK